MLNDLYQNLDPVAFSIGSLDVRWYGIAYLLGFVCAAVIMYRVAKHWRIELDTDSISTIILCLIIGVIVGARLGYCLFYGDGQYAAHPIKILALNEGGMSFHGGLVGALLGAFVAVKILHMPYLTLADLGAIAAPAGLFFGRCANFVNGELWGAETDLPWGVVFGGSAGMVPRHPSQLYEALLEGILLLIILYALSRKTPARPQGTFIGVFLVGYGIIRFSLEFIRQPDIQLGYLWGGWLTMGQVLSIPLIIAGICIVIFAARKGRPQSGVGSTR